VFDSKYSLYIVTGYVDVYFHSDSFYRVHKGSIQVSTKADGPWHKANSKKVPSGLEKKIAADAKKDKDDDKGKGKGKDKDKGKKS
jgi:hypothetical protein